MPPARDCTISVITDSIRWFLVLNGCNMVIEPSGIRTVFINDSINSSITHNFKLIINPLFYFFIFEESPAPVPAQNQELTTKEIASLVEKLGFGELKRLYMELELTDEEVEAAEAEAFPSQNKLEKAKKVFKKWKSDKGDQATKMALLRALKESKLIDTMQKMQKEWGIV